MHAPIENARDYLYLLARLRLRPGILHELDLSDVVQQTLLKGHKNAHQFRGSTEAQWRSWLRAILENELRQAANGDAAGLRSLDESSRFLDEIAADEQTPTSQQMLRDEQLEQMAVALGQLPQDERTAIELKHLHGRSVAFISAQMGRTKQATAGVLKRGMRRLRENLGASSDREAT
jgi:RNA polymerase sigma-70 factor, ECF subfamily